MAHDSVPVFPFSPLADGTWRLLDERPGISPQELLKRLATCAELGVTTIDTAGVYGAYQVEELLGAALALGRGLRERLQIVSKLGMYDPHPSLPGHRVAFYDATAANIRLAVDKSLRLLRLDVIDLLLLHRPDWL